MSMTDEEILEKVLDELRKDGALSAYVKSFVHESAGTAMVMFPFISIGNFSRDTEPGTIGRKYIEEQQCLFEITAMTRSYDPKIAHRGDGKGKKGIVHIWEDIVRVIWPNNFGGMFEDPVFVRSVAIGHKREAGGTIWAATILVEGTIRVVREVS